MIEPVRRYNPEGYTQPASRSGTGTHMVECKDGDYVLASDYDAVQAERDGANERAGLLLKAVLATEADLDQAVRTAEYWKAEHLAGNAVIDQLRTAIADPESVFANMKRGTIAKPGLRSMIDLYGEVPNGDETQLLEIAQLRAEVEQLRQQAALTQQPAASHELFAELYQILGALGATETVLDQVLAASHGDPLPHASLLPYAAEIGRSKE